MELSRLENRGESKFNALLASDAALDYVADVGFDAVYGARPLKRTIQEQLLNPLAKQLLDGEFKPGDHIRVSLANGELAFET